jgi:putative NIF3 family GTP cyclohydrolase 1 type 2
LLEAAAAATCDMYVTGELAERAAGLAKELTITLVAAGHVATEVFGPMRIAEELNMKFPGLSAEFIAVANPI